MSDVRIRCSARCIQDACNSRLTNLDDSKEIRQFLRQVLGHTRMILEVDAANDAAPAPKGDENDGR